MLKGDRTSVEEARLMPARLLASILTLGCTIFIMALSGKAANPPIPSAKLDAPLAAAAGKQTAVFGGGCFWGTQAVFERVKACSRRLRATPAAPPRPLLTGKWS